MMYDTCIFAVIFPANLPYFERFLNSLEEQDYKKFDLLLLNDSVDEVKLQSFINQSNLQISVQSCSGSISQIRAQGLELLQRSLYENIIFADTDDFFPPNRVTICRKYLKTYDLVVNDLSSFTEQDQNNTILQEGYLSNRLSNRQIIAINNILTGSFIGLGNTAVRKKALKNISLPAEIEVVDWYLFASILDLGAKAVFTNETVTFYRQHPLNLIGLNNLLKEGLLDKVNQKKNIYFYLKDVNPSYSDYYSRTLTLIDFLKADSNNLNWYFEYILANKPEFPFWWEEILIPVTI